MDTQVDDNLSGPPDVTCGRGGESRQGRISLRLVPDLSVCAVCFNTSPAEQR